jgi:hypothetical protein
MGDLAVITKSMTVKMLGAALLVVTVPSLADSPPEPSLEDANFIKAIVQGEPAHLKQFDENLRNALGFSDLEAHLMGCTEGCDKLGGLPPPERLVYVFPRELRGILGKFGKAWDTTQKAVKDPDFMLMFNASIPPPVCTGPQNPPPCQSMPFCAQDACGRKVNNRPDCTAC